MTALCLESDGWDLTFSTFFKENATFNLNSNLSEDSSAAERALQVDHVSWVRH